MISIDDVIAIIRDEPELLGDMPDECRSLVQTYGIELGLRAAVRGTKNSLIKRFTALQIELEANLGAG